MSKKSILILVIIIILLIGGYFTYSYIQSNSVSYQMNKLLNGNSKQKVMAAKYMGDNKITEAIPLLVESIDSDDSFLYEGKARWTIKCIATVSLDKITGENIGNLCNDDMSKTDEQLNLIKSNWKDWYENEYQKTN